MSSSSSASGVNLTEQIENVFDQLISKIEHADPDFDPRPFLKQLNVLGRYEPIKRNVYFTKRYIEDYGISCHCKPSPGSSVVCGRDCYCGMLFSCCSSQCECDNTCTNKSFQHRPLKKTKLIKDCHAWFAAPPASSRFICDRSIDRRMASFLPFGVYRKSATLNCDIRAYMPLGIINCNCCFFQLPG